MSAFQEIDLLAEETVLSSPDSFRLPARTIREMTENGITEAEISQIVGSTVELESSIVSGTLSPEQSERAARLAHIVSMAERIFADREKAFLWLRLPSETLDGNTPIRYLSTEAGARFVEEMLVRIDHGIAA